MKITIIQFSGIKILMLISFLSIFGCNQKTAEKPSPNIVWIIADDYSPDAEIFGTEAVATPNLNRLASEGKVFTNAFSTNPVCSPSRSALYTGVYQTSIGAHQHRTINRSELPENTPVIMEYFRKAGYFTSNGNGKSDSKKGKTDFNFKAENAFDGTDWSQRKPGQPFFASIQIHNPHRPFEKDTDNPVDPKKVKLPPYYPDHPVSRKDWANYLESVQEMDTKVGEVLKRLEEENLLENTIVFFFSDQGRPHVRDKQWLYDGGIQVPLIVRFPDKAGAGQKDNKLVSLIDVTYSSIELAGISPGSTLQGMDFLDENKNREFIYAARDRTDAVVDQIRCIRTKKFKYIRNFMPERPYTQFGHYKMYNYPVLTLMKSLYEKGELNDAQTPFMVETKPEEELYNLENDPYELNNLAGNEKYAQELQRLRKTLDDTMKGIGDKGSFDPDSYEDIQKRREKKYGKRWEERGINPKETAPEVYLQWWEKELGLVQ